MPRKPNTVHKQIAQEYRAWLRANPAARRYRRMGAFNRIADKHLDEERVQQAA